MTTLLGLLGALLTGAASAVFPVVNAEAYAAVAATSLPVLPLVVAVATGQTAGKLALFVAAGRGAGHHVAKLAESRWGGRLTGWLASRRTGGPVVLAAATVGLPPLALVSVAAGAAGQSWRLFAVMCAVGRAARFAALVASVVWIRA